MSTNQGATRTYQTSIYKIKIGFIEEIKIRQLTAPRELFAVWDSVCHQNVKKHVSRKNRDYSINL